jgi:PDZ domain-containing protein
MSRRGVTLLIASVGVIGSMLVATLLSVPYVALLPGPTYNTLGPLNGKPVIAISGHRTFSTKGHLNMVTVSFIGGPGARPPFNIWAAIQAWLSPHNAVVPETELFPSGQTQQSVQKQDTEQMVDSQQSATAAALCYLNIKFAITEEVASTIAGTPAAGVLRKGDDILAVDGTPVSCHATAGDLIRAKPVGQPIVLAVRRSGKLTKFTLHKVSYQGQSVVGVNLLDSFQFPFKVKISIGNVGGPSAGMMFALGIIDKLTPMNLSGGKFIAGTGEIDSEGDVSPIGGIQQKMAGARAAGATVFLAPATNCSDTRGAVPSGLRIIKVSTLSGAIAALQALKLGKPVPTC